MHVRDIGEFGLIERLRAIVAAQPPGDEAGIVAGIGDDTAVLQPTLGLRLLATCDVQIDGVHFLADRTQPRDIGHKTLAVNLSDIAGMGGRPRWALVSLGLAPSTQVGFVEEVYRGMQALATAHGVAIVGGNVSRAGGAIFFDVTVMGEVEPAATLTRAGARPGDVVAVTGTLGDSAAGLRLLLEPRHGVDPRARAALLDRHRRPEPRIALGRALAATGVVTAMLDVSDGLAQDLGHVCDASGVGATIDVASLPLSTSLLEFASATGVDPFALAQHGGEDYELLLTLPADGFEAAARAVRQAGGPALSQIGHVTEGGLSRRLPDGTVEPLPAVGHDHLRDRGATPRSEPGRDRPPRNRRRG